MLKMTTGTIFILAESHWQQKSMTNEAVKLHVSKFMIAIQ